LAGGDFGGALADSFASGFGEDFNGALGVLRAPPAPTSTRRREA
jgi:hypothetical protein